MKKSNIFSVMPIFLLALGLAFTACDNGSTGGGTSGSPFDGTWRWTGDGYGKTGYTFKGSSFTEFTDRSAFWSTRSGTFTYTDTTITFSFESGTLTDNGKTTTIPYDGARTEYYTLTDSYFHFKDIEKRGTFGIYIKDGYKARHLTIESLFNQLSSYNIEHFGVWSTKDNAAYYYRNGQWEKQDPKDYTLFTPAPNFKIADAVNIGGYAYREQKSEANPNDSLIIEKLNSIFTEKYRTPEDPLDRGGDLAGKTLYGWYEFDLDENGRAEYGRSDKESRGPHTISYYMF
jgi:hypothetical protein